MVPGHRPVDSLAADHDRGEEVIDMADVLNLQDDGPELPDEEKLSNSSWVFCGGGASNKSRIFC